MKTRIYGWNDRRVTAQEFAERVFDLMVEGWRLLPPAAPNPTPEREVEGR